MTVVGAQVGNAGLGGGRQFEADDLGGEPGGSVEVGDTGTDVRDVGELDHRLGSGINGREVDVDLPVTDQIAVVHQDVGVGHRDGLAVLAPVLHVDLHDDRVAELPHVLDVVGEAVDRGEEAGHGLVHRAAPGDRVRVGEAELRVRREVGDERARIEAVDVGEDLGNVSAHNGLPTLETAGDRPSPKLYPVSWECAMQWVSAAAGSPG